MKKEKIDYEQLYFDLLYENKQLKWQIKELKEEIELLKKDKGKILKSEIVKEINSYFQKSK